MIYTQFWRCPHKNNQKFIPLIPPQSFFDQSSWGSKLTITQGKQCNVAVCEIKACV